MADCVGRCPELRQETRAFFRRAVRDDVVTCGLAQNGEERAVQGPRVRYERFQRVGAAPTHQRVRVLAIRQRDDAQCAVGLQQGQRGGDGAGRGPGTSGIAIEAQGRRGRLAPQFFELFLGQCGPERRYCAGQSTLVQGDDVHVALDHHQVAALADRLTRQIEAIEGAALGEDGRFRTVEIFRLAVAEGTAAKAHDPAAPVANGKHQPVEEKLAARHSVFALPQQPGFEQLRRRDLRAREFGRQGAAAVARPAEAECGNARLGDAPGCQVAARGNALRRCQPVGEKYPGRLQHALQIEPRPLGRHGAGLRPRHVEPRLARQRLHCFEEGGAVGLHDEADGIAVRAASETMVAVLVDVETGRLLAVKRAAPL